MAGLSEQEYWQAWKASDRRASKDCRTGQHICASDSAPVELICSNTDGRTRWEHKAFRYPRPNGAQRNSLDWNEDRRNSRAEHESDGKCSSVGRRARHVEETRIWLPEGFHDDMFNIRCLVQYEIQVEKSWHWTNEMQTAVTASRL